MMRNKILPVLFLLTSSFGVTPQLFAQAVTDPEITQKITLQMQKFFPDTQPDKISTTPIAGLYEVILGPKVYYITPDARYLMLANIIDLKNGASLTRPSLLEARLAAVDKLGPQKMISFAPENPKYTLTAFTDIDCGYCRKMHSQMQQYNQLGIAFNYLFYPRTGVGTESYNTAVSVWCNKDRKTAFTQAKAGKKIKSRSCANPVGEHMALVEKLQLRGTPALILPNGDLVESYIPPVELLKLLKSTENNS